MVAQRICDAMLPELSRVFAVSLAQAAQVVSVFAMTYGASQLFYGPLGDRLGKFRVVTFATLGCSIGSLLAVFAHSLDALLFARMLMALGAAALIPLGMAWVGDNVPADQLQEMLTRTGLGSTLGIVCGQLIGGLLTDALGWRWSFVFMTVLFAVVGTLLYVDLRRQHAAQHAEGKDPAAAPHQPVQRTHFVTQALEIITGPVVTRGADHGGDRRRRRLWRAGHLGLAPAPCLGFVALGVRRHRGAVWLGRRRVHGRRPPADTPLRPARPGDSGWRAGWHQRPGAGLHPALGPGHPGQPWVGGFGFFMFHNVMQANATQMGAPCPRHGRLNVCFFPVPGPVDWCGAGCQPD
jgi:YNFM family putative membrane transporter